MEPYFRRADLADLEGLLALEAEAFGRTWPEGAFRQELELPQAQVWLAFGREAKDLEKLNHPLGYADFWVVEDEVSLLNVAVHPQWRRRGLGTALVELVKREGQASGGRRVFLEVRASNSAAIALYRSEGFEQVGIRKGYYAPEGEDALVLACPLDAGEVEG